MKIFDHIKAEREWYILLPVAIALLIFVAWFVAVLTGRAPADDAGALFGCTQNLFIASLVIALTGFTKPHLFDDIDTTQPTVSICRAILDSCETLSLLLFFAYLLRQ